MPGVQGNGWQAQLPYSYVYVNSAQYPSMWGTQLPLPSYAPNMPQWRLNVSAVDLTRELHRAIREKNPDAISELCDHMQRDLLAFKQMRDHDGAPPWLHGFFDIRADGWSVFDRLSMHAHGSQNLLAAQRLDAVALNANEVVPRDDHGRSVDQRIFCIHSLRDPGELGEFVPLREAVYAADPRMLEWVVQKTKAIEHEWRGAIVSKEILQGLVGHAEAEKKPDSARILCSAWPDRGGKREKNYAQAIEPGGKQPGRRAAVKRWLSKRSEAIKSFFVPQGRPAPRGHDARGQAAPNAGPQYQSNRPVRGQAAPGSPAPDQRVQPQHTRTGRM